MHNPRLFYGNSIINFLNEPANNIVGALTTAASNAGFVQQQHTQTAAWHTQIASLKGALSGNNGSSDQGYVLLEYTIPRRGKRVDAVLLYKEIIFVIEYKAGAKSFSRNDIAQVEDYALDLRDFHYQKRNFPLSCRRSQLDRHNRSCFAGN